MEAEHPEWRRRLNVARDHSAPWIEAHIPLAGRTVLEYGCGQGAVTCALAPRAGRYIGVDIDAEALEMARGHVARLGVEDVELRHAPADRLLEEVADLRGEVDVVLLYAVLEHMTLEERLALLTLARELPRPGGHVIVTETPNRLTPIDHHTGQMPSLHQLPDELATRYYRRSRREDFVASLDAAAAAGPEALLESRLRWGVGVSFHEFEVAFGDLATHTVASSYHPALYRVRPVRWEELQLAAVLEAWRPDLPPCWARTWLDTILAVEPLDAARSFVRPWPLRVAPDVPGVGVLPDGRLELRPGARLPVVLPGPTREVHVGLMAPEPAHALRIVVDGQTLAPVAEDNADAIPPWQSVARLPVATDRVEVELIDGGCLTWLGFDGPPDPEAPDRRPFAW